MSVLNKKAGGCIAHSLIIQVYGSGQGAVEKQEGNSGLFKLRHVLQAFCSKCLPQHRIHPVSEKRGQRLFFTFQGRAGV